MSNPIIPSPDNDRMFSAHTDIAERIEKRFSELNYFDSTRGYVVSFDKIAKTTSLEIKDGKLQFKLVQSETPPDDFRFAFYLLQDGSAIQQIGYGPNPECQFELPTDGIYCVKYFLNNGRANRSYLSPAFVVKDRCISTIENE